MAGKDVLIKVIGFIGAGNMARAIMTGIASGKDMCGNIFAYNPSKRDISLEGVKLEFCSSNIEVVRKSKYIFLAVKPDVYGKVLNEIKDHLNEEKVLITMAAGYQINMVKEIVGDVKVVRTMPNTPALVGQGFTVVCFDDVINESEKENVLEMLKTFGIAQVTQEKYIDAYSAVTGSGPAYIFMIAEAMADAAVMLGIPRKEAYMAVEQMIMGSAKLALDTEKHPGELKDMVCSPGGTTIEGVRTLEETGLRSALIECIINTYKKNININYIR